MESWECPSLFLLGRTAVGALIVDLFVGMFTRSDNVLPKLGKKTNLVLYSLLYLIGFCQINEGTNYASDFLLLALSPGRCFIELLDAITKRSD